eukprot:scaffold130401_cov32-Tisochrysis_lutea.AAC.2
MGAAYWHTVPARISWTILRSLPCLCLAHKSSSLPSATAIAMIRPESSGRASSGRAAPCSHTLSNTV